MSEIRVVNAEDLKRRVAVEFEYTHSVGAFLKLIDEMPPVKEVETVKQGVWLYTEAEGGLKYWLCSNCRNSYHKKNPHDMKRCYRCGAYMRMDDGYSR